MQHETFIRDRRAVGRGFTLVELLVVIAVIGLAMAIALPTMSSFFGTAESIEQAYNVVRGQVAAAQTLAGEENTFAAVHIQQGRPDDSDIAEKAFSAIYVYDRSKKKFVLAGGHRVQELPGNAVFGEVSGDFVNGGSYQSVGDAGSATFRDFTSMTIVFAPDGTVVKTPRGNDVTLDTDENVFESGEDGVWDPDDAKPEPGVTAVTLFSMRDIRGMGASGIKNYLDEAGFFLSVNVYTGQIIPLRERE
ncbi:MAG: Tfp pilus assembly protein FimT/FimU [Phycisphaerae bacterium]